MYVALIKLWKSNKDKDHANIALLLGSPEYLIYCSVA